MSGLDDSIPSERFTRDLLDEAFMHPRQRDSYADTRRLIGRLRVMLHGDSISQDDYTTLCEAIRALGGQP